MSGALQRALDVTGFTSPVVTSVHVGLLTGPSCRMGDGIDVSRSRG